MISYVLTPVFMEILCPTGKPVNDCFGKIEAWAGSAVDTRCIHPVGKRAHNHFVLWKQTRYVISGKWCQGNVALMLSAFRPWRWETEREKHSGLFVSISSNLIDSSARFFFEAPVGNLTLGFTSSDQARAVVAAIKKRNKKKPLFHGLRFEEGSVSLLTNNTELFWQPVAGSLQGLVQLQCEDDGKLRTSSDGAGVALPCVAERVGRRLALISDETIDAWPCWWAK